jgi:hypothetical protein
VILVFDNVEPELPTWGVSLGKVNPVDVVKRHTGVSLGGLQQA